VTAGGADVAGALLEALTPGCGLGLAVHDEDLRMLVISPSLAELSGAPAEAQLGRRLTEALPGEVGEVAEASLRVVADTREPLLHLEPAIEAGRERGWLISVYPLEYGGRELIAVVALDVTESRRAHDRLRESRERLAAAQRMAGVGSWSWDVVADAWSWSSELFRLIGLEEQERPPPFAQVLRAVAPSSRDEVRRITAAALRDGMPYELSFPVVLPGGRRRILRGRGVPVRGDDGRVVRIDGFAQDITELSRAATRQSAVAALGRMALSGVPIDVLLRLAVDTVLSELELDYALVAEREGDRLVARAVRVGSDPRLAGHEPTFGPESLAAYTLSTGAAVIVPDWEAETTVPRPPMTADADLGSSAAVPIGSPEARFGVLSGHALEPGRVTEEDVAFMESVATIVASAVVRLAAEDEVADQSAARGRLVAQALDAEDRARRGISEALHDGPLQDLLALGHDVARLEASTEQDEHHLERVRAGLARAVRQIREVMLDLHPVLLQVGGLESALRAICAQSARTGGYDCDVEIDPRASGPRDELVLSLARELLRNVAKHAMARNVDVLVRRTPEAVVLDVTDDGIGIEPGRARAALAQGHIGLASSYERAEAIGGSMRVGPRADGLPGTQAVAVLPVA
jgi:signal transduction histidine kinase/PAS domain-containing protein